VATADFFNGSRRIFNEAYAVIDRVQDCRLSAIGQNAWDLQALRARSEIGVGDASHRTLWGKGCIVPAIARIASQFNTLTEKLPCWR
jgi:hypothetical protein